MERRYPTDGLTASGFLLLSLGLLILPLRWVLAWLLAAAIHECCHLIAVKLCGGSVAALRLNGWGASMVANDLSAPQEFLCVLAGPIGGAVVLLPLMRFLPATAICGLLQSAYNLLPFIDLDGGRSLRIVLEFILPKEKAARIAWIVHAICVLVVLSFGIYSAFWLKLGIMPLILSIWLVIKGNSGKRPCNQSHLAVQ